jgi:hypothetical protein
MNLRPLLLALVLAAAGTSADAKRPSTDYTAYAGPPVAGFTYRHLYNWQRTHDRQLVVWTKPSAAYLLTLHEACEDLSGRAIFEIGGVSAILGQVRAGSGDVRIGALRCQVDRIQPLDVARMRADRA